MKDNGWVIVAKVGEFRRGEANGQLRRHGATRVDGADPGVGAQDESGGRAGCQSEAGEARTDGGTLSCRVATTRPELLAIVFDRAPSR